MQLIDWIFEFIQKSTARTGTTSRTMTVTEKIQETSATIQYMSQLLNKLEDLFSDISKMSREMLLQIVCENIDWKDHHSRGRPI